MAAAMEMFEDYADIVAVLVDVTPAGRRILPITAAVADAINDGRIATFNMYLSLDLREQILMAPLYRQRERMQRVPSKGFRYK